jgi:hypothetical protein
LRRSYEEYSAKLVGKQGEEFPIAALVKVIRIIIQEFSKIGETSPWLLFLLMPVCVACAIALVGL